ncbi:hypothetical protein D3C78_1161070 [compost metagenome]
MLEQSDNLGIDKTHTAGLETGLQRMHDTIWIHHAFARQEQRVTTAIFGARGVGSFDARLNRLVRLRKLLQIALDCVERGIFISVGGIVIEQDGTQPVKVSRDVKLFDKTTPQPSRGLAQLKFQAITGMLQGARLQLREGIEHCRRSHRGTVWTLCRAHYHNLLWCHLARKPGCDCEPDHTIANNQEHRANLREFLQCTATGK